MGRILKSILLSKLDLALLGGRRDLYSCIARSSVMTIAAVLNLGFFPMTPARANLIQNPGFEAGNLAAWTATGNVATARLPYFGEGSNAVDGNYFATFNSGDSTPNGVLSQSFATVAGTQYNLTYLYGANGGQIQRVTTSFRDAQGAVLATQLATLPAVSNSLSPFSLAFTADTALSVLSFTDLVGNPTVSTDGFIDNVSVAAVPEPSSFALLGFATCGCFSAIRWRQRRVPPFQRAE